MPWHSEMFWPSPDADKIPPPVFAADFAASMPPRYQVLFDPKSVRIHAGVSYRRAGSPARAEVWRSLPDRSAALCVVADDRPGVLSAIAASLTSHRLDVITALVFSRPAAGVREAVDILWVRRDRADDLDPIDDEEAESIGEVLSAILAGRVSVEEIASRRTADLRCGDAVIQVAFGDGDPSGHSVLRVEAPDRAGLLMTIALELFKQGAQIVRSLVRTADGRAFNEFDLTEFSGSPLTAVRKDEIRAAVARALTLREV
ncbi:MAG: hypothetical protein ACRENE_31825 [Polyangiaceae bacterium]